MERETLEDQLRRATRNFTAALPEDQVLTLGRDLARELARAHAESPPRHPELELRAIPMADGSPRLEGGDASGDAAEDLFQLGALLVALATGTEASVSWRLDGPPPLEMSTLGRRAVLGALAAPRRSDRFPSAAAAPPPSTPPWPRRPAAPPPGRSSAATPPGPDRDPPPPRHPCSPYGKRPSGRWWPRRS
jgi:hypothetical protein